MDMEGKEDMAGVGSEEGRNCEEIVNSMDGWLGWG